VATWAFSTRPAVPVYCRCTPAVAVPYDDPVVYAAPAWWQLGAGAGAGRVRHYLGCLAVVIFVPAVWSMHLIDQTGRCQ
jgi:hypothetical protein